jgi:hypothetical protein
LQPDDIDFPVSRGWYRFYASKNHWPDPGPVYEDLPEQRKELVQLRTIINNYNARPSELNTKGGNKQQAVNQCGVSL